MATWFFKVTLCTTKWFCSSSFFLMVQTWPITHFEYKILTLLIWQIENIFWGPIIIISTRAPLSVSNWWNPPKPLVCYPSNNQSHSIYSSLYKLCNILWWSCFVKLARGNNKNPFHEKWETINKPFWKCKRFKPLQTSVIYTVPLQTNGNDSCSTDIQFPKVVVCVILGTEIEVWAWQMQKG